ncbi:MAG TPA: SET domain-containing protein [Turneriella sp.]|nr:SET domain-containing protein [Turneriella sp.]
MKFLIVLLIGIEKAAAHVFHVEGTMISTPAAPPTEAQQKNTPGDSPLEVRPTRFGKGVFARREFAAGTRILQFRGRVYTRAEYLSKVNPVKCHYMQIGDNAFLGPTTTPDNFVNHCCEPNAGIVIENGKAWLVAIQIIRPEDEITFDYSTSMAEDHWEMDCACGAASCRGRVRDFKHLQSPLQQKYIALGIVPDFVIRSAGLENPNDLFHTADTRPAKGASRRRVPAGQNGRNNIGTSLNHAPRNDGVHAGAELGSSLNHASPAY